MSTIASPRQPPPQSHPQAPASPITSSARSSLSIDRNTTGTGPRRNRTALRDYYKLPVPTTPTDTGSASTSTRSPSPPPSTTHALLAPLDVPNFSAHEYIQHLLQTSSLEDVLRVESALIGEIRGADGERKALVYDNYSKLIKATETIRSMRVKMEGEAEDSASVKSDIWGPVGAASTSTGGGEGVNVRARVGPMIDRIAELAASVATVDANAAAVERLQSAQVQQSTAESNTSPRPPTSQQQATVRWVLSAPSRLEALVIQGSLEEARKEWERLAPLLEKWKGVRGVEEVRLAAEKAMGTADGG